MLTAKIPTMTRVPLPTLLLMFLLPGAVSACAFLTWAIPARTEAAGASPWSNHRADSRQLKRPLRPPPPSPLASGVATDGEESDDSAAAFDRAVAARYACTRFRRHREPDEQDDDEEEDDDDNGGEGGEGEQKKKSASLSDPSVVREASRVLDLSRRSPSGFNAQPYRAVLVSSPAAKEKLAEWCLGRNADRVRDSDVTAVFLADREWGRDWGRYGTFLSDGGGGDNNKNERRRPPPGKWKSRYVRSLILLFSSGLPLPRLLAAPISYCMRLAVAFLGQVLGLFGRLLVPTLSSAETWSTKNASLVAMSYLLGCASRGLDTCPMEGYWAPGVRAALGVPRRYAVPLIVSTGRDYHTSSEEGGEVEEEDDDVGMSHGSPGEGSAGATPRYPLGEIVFENRFGEAASSL